MLAPLLCVTVVPSAVISPLVLFELVIFYFFFPFYFILFISGKLNFLFRSSLWKGPGLRPSAGVLPSLCVVSCAIISSLVSTEPVNFSERLFSQTRLACKLVVLNVTFYKFKHQILNIEVNKRSKWQT